MSNDGDRLDVDQFKRQDTAPYAASPQDESDGVAVKRRIKYFKNSHAVNMVLFLWLWYVSSIL
jgi:hypothetical protein